MKLLFIGDIIGRAGRRIVAERLGELRARYGLDAVIANGENAAGGFGITPAICEQLYGQGIDVLTTGNHVFDQRELIGAMDGDARLLRPLNMMPGTPGHAVARLTTARGRRLVVLQVIGRLFMGSYDDPFRALEAELARHALGGSCDALVVDLHAEATSEKMAIGHFLDGRVSLVAGTHTHVPTADAQVLPGGTAYVSDVGMTGDYDSVIGMDKATALGRFRSHVRGARLEPALGEPTLCAVLLETDARGLARRVAPLRLGGRLEQALPEP